MNHKIRQQFIDIEYTGTEDEGLEIQRMLPDFYYQNLLPAIENAFDYSFPPDLVLRIDRIEVDAGTVDFNRIGREFADSVVKELMKVIRGGEPGKDAELLNSIQGIPVSFIENLVDVFIYFLKTGCLPWNYMLNEGTTLEDELVEAFDKKSQDSGSDSYFLKIKVVLSGHHAVKRLVNQFTYPFQSRLLVMISPEVSAIANRIFSLADRGTLLPEIKNEFRKCLFESAFNYSIVSEKPSELGLITLLSGILPARLNTIAEISGIFHPLQNPTTTITEGKQNGKSNSDYLHVREKEGLYIENAGLILLHPFLPGFFETLGITKKYEMIKPSRALSLLHFLATAQTSAPEYLLVLPKLLCGMPVFAPVTASDNINVNESDETMVLLTAVILHWSALRNTSPDALRETFLKRQGKLYQENGIDWILHVESQTFDVLLRQLPWGIGHIQLPWMKHLLKVEWNY